MAFPEPTLLLHCRDEHVFVDRRGDGWAFVLLDLSGAVGTLPGDHRVAVLVCEGDDDFEPPEDA